MAQEGISTVTVWTIKDFSKLPAQKLYSDAFVLGGYKWRVLAYPKGNFHKKVYDHLSLYLDVADSSTFPDGWSIDVESFSITVVNQVHAKNSIKETATGHRFNAQTLNWGFKSLISLSILNDPATGYLLHDTLVVEVRVSVSTESSSNLLKKTQSLLAELSNMNGVATTPGNEISSPSPQSLEQQRKALDDYLALLPEAIKLTTAFDEIERLTFQLVPDSANSTILDNLMSILTTFKGVVLPPIMNSSIENVKAHLISLSGKSADVGARLEQGQEQLSSLVATYSKLSEEELSLEAEFLRLTNEKQELLLRKKLVVLELKKTNMQTSKDLAEWRDIIKETEGIDEDWPQTRAKQPKLVVDSEIAVDFKILGLLSKPSKSDDKRNEVSCRSLSNLTTKRMESHVEANLSRRVFGSSPL